MKKLLLPSTIFTLALCLVMVSSALAGFEVHAEKVGDARYTPEAPLPDLIVVDGYTSKDHSVPTPPPAFSFTIGSDELNCNVFVNVPFFAPVPLTATYTLILIGLDGQGLKVEQADFEISKKGVWRLTVFWGSCPEWPGPWLMIPIVKSSTGSQIPYNPGALHVFNIHY